MQTISPSQMRGAMLSPWHSRAKSARHARPGRPMYSLMFSSARMGVPQAMEPTSGTLVIWGSGSNPAGMVPGASTPVMGTSYPISHDTETPSAPGKGVHSLLLAFPVAFEIPRNARFGDARPDREFRLRHALPVQPDPQPLGKAFDLFCHNGSHPFCCFCVYYSAPVERMQCFFYKMAKSQFFA